LLGFLRDYELLGHYADRHVTQLLVLHLGKPVDVDHVVPS